MRKLRLREIVSCSWLHVWGVGELEIELVSVVLFSDKNRDTVV